MGRAPCCDKANVKKGPWSPEEDAKLKSYIEKHGTGGNWIALPQKIGLKRCGKSCRLRWLNYLRPNIKHGGFSEEEDNIICSLYISIGSRWSIIAAQLPGRTDNDIKNYWNTRLKKKLLGNKQRKEQHSRRGKQDHMKRGLNANQMISPDHNYSNCNQNPHWPDLPSLAPIPLVSNLEPRFNDHASIRKLLVKLGGRLSDGDQISRNPQFSYSHQICDQPINVSSSSTLMETLDNGNPQFPQTQYNMDWLQMLQGQSNFTEEEIQYNNNPQRLDGLEFLLADHQDMLNDRIGSTSSDQVVTGSLGEISSIIYPPLPSNCAFDGLRYPGSL